MSRQFRYVVHTPGVQPVAAFDNYETAHKFRSWFLEDSGYSMELIITDQSEDLDADRAQLNAAKSLVKAVKELMRDE